MPLTVLSEAEVCTLLHSLDRQDVLDLQQVLADALHYYSTTTDEEEGSAGSGCCSTLQPLRTALKRANGQTTLFMPASSNEGFSVKIVTLGSNPPAAAHAEQQQRRGAGGAEALSALDSLSLSSSETATPPTVSSTSTAYASSGSSGAPLGSMDSRQSKGSSTSSTSASASSATATGSLTLVDARGRPRALVGAAELTAFRTALASTMLFKKRANVHDVVVFGAGRQAYWHIRLALLLRGREIHHLNIINRSFDRAHRLMERLYAVPHDDDDDDDDDKTSPPPACRPAALLPLDGAAPKMTLLTPAHTEYTRLLKATVRASAAIFCTTPARAPLFPASYLTSAEGRRKGRYVVAVGSAAPDRAELHPDVLVQNAAAPHHGHHHHHGHAPHGGAIVVDSVDACLRDAGEIVQAGLGGADVVELGELLMLKRDAVRRRAEAAAGPAHPTGAGSHGDCAPLDSSGVELGGECAHRGNKRRGGGDNKGASSTSAPDVVEQGLFDWLQRGNVIYKSVGLGLMDVVVGHELVRLADKRGIGTRIEDF